MAEETKIYSNGDVSILWKPSLCIHSGKCWKSGGLPQVFNPKARPWINPLGADSASIIRQVRQCPSGALSIEGDQEEGSPAGMIVEVNPNGPLIIRGRLQVKCAGEITEKNGAIAFCRCGHSANKPYCDGSHRQVKFE